jgi:hypothetical protein
MSRRSVLGALRTAHVCEQGLYECPKCKTLGCTWDWPTRSWRKCGLCNGGGYLSSPGEACGN